MSPSMTRLLTYQIVQRKALQSLVTCQRILEIRDNYLDFCLDRTPAIQRVSNKND